MAGVEGQSRFCPLRGRSAHILDVGVLAWFLIYCVFWSTHLFFASGSPAAGDPLAIVPPPDTEKQISSASPGAAGEWEPSKAISSSPHRERTTLLPAAHDEEDVQSANEEERVEKGHKASEWWRWNPLSSFMGWIRYHLNISRDRRDTYAVLEPDPGSPITTSDVATTTCIDRTSIRSFFGRLASLFSTSPARAAPKPSEVAFKGSVRESFYPRECSAAVCREIALQIQTDVNCEADPCTNVNEYYCGNWMRHTKELQGENSWITYMDSASPAPEDILKAALEHLSCPAEQQKPEARSVNVVKLDADRNSSTIDLPSTHAKTHTQDEWYSLLACSYRACMDQETLEIRGAKPLFAAMFDSHGSNAAPLSFLVQSNFVEEAEAAGQADRLMAIKVESAEADAVISSINSLIAAAGGSPTEAAGESSTATSGTGDGKVRNQGRKNLLRILVPRLRSIYKRMNAQFFWSLLTAPHELDGTKGQTLTIADLILGLPYHQFEMKYADQQLSYKRHLARLLRSFDTHLAQYRREIYEAGRTSNPNMKLSYDERARRIFDFEAKVLRKIVLSPGELNDVEKNTHIITFEQVKKSAKFLNVEAVIKIYMQDLAVAVSTASGSTPSFASRMATITRNMNGVTVTESGEVVIGDNAEFVIYQKNYFSQIEKVLYDPRNWAVLHDYILVNLIRNQAKMLSEDFSSAGDEFLSSLLGTAPASRSRRCLQALPQWLLGRLYVQRTSSIQNKALAKKIVQNLESAFEDAIKQSAWMDAATQEHALRKLAAMIRKIGYPDWLLDTTKSQVFFEKNYGNSSAALAALQIGYYEFVDHMRRQNIIAGLRNYGTPTDQEEWTKAPHEVSGEYSRYRNEFLVTAAFLRKPIMYTPSSDASVAELMVVNALNYGGFGAYIGHKLAHAFDSEGSQHDAEGNIWNWWSTESEDAFEDMVQCLRDQYSKYFIELDFLPNADGNQPANRIESPSRSVEGSDATDAGLGWDPMRATSHDLSNGTSETLPQESVAGSVAGEAAAETRRKKARNTVKHRTKRELFLDGANTVDENFADNVGLQMAWAALQKELTVEQLSEKPMKKLGSNFTVKQLFLFAWGHLWCEVSSPAVVARKILTQAYTPSRFRSEGTLANFDLFAEEYLCPGKTPLNPEKKCKVW